MSDLLDVLFDGVLETVIEGAMELAGEAPALAERAARGAGKAYRKGRELGVTGAAGAATLAVAGTAAARRHAARANRTRTRAGITPENLRAVTTRGRAAAAPLLARALRSGQTAATRLRAGALTRMQAGR